MFGIGGWEMLVIGVIALLIFGPKRLPDLARSLGKGLAEFRRASSDLRRSIDLDLDPTRLSARDPEHEPPAQAGSPAAPDEALEPGQTDAKQTDTKQTDAKQTDTKQTDAKQTDTKQPDTKQPKEPAPAAKKSPDGAGG